MLWTPSLASGRRETQVCDLKFPLLLQNLRLTASSSLPSLRAPSEGAEFIYSSIRMAKSHERGIQVKKGESVDRALKRLKQKLDTEGIIEEMRRRRAFETPTQRKIRKHRTAIKRNRVRWRYVSEATERKIAERKAAAAAQATQGNPS